VQNVQRTNRRCVTANFTAFPSCSSNIDDAVCGLLLQVAAAAGQACGQYCWGKRFQLTFVLIVVFFAVVAKEKGHILGDKIEF
jgi:hypothetical protein